jgi:hypothetical protein
MRIFDGVVFQSGPALSKIVKHQIVKEAPPPLFVLSPLLFKTFSKVPNPIKVPPWSHSFGGRVGPKGSLGGGVKELCLRGNSMETIKNLTRLVSESNLPNTFGVITNKFLD